MFLEGRKEGRKRLQQDRGGAVGRTYSQILIVCFIGCSNEEEFVPQKKNKSTTLVGSIN